jgi:hypothetical protein
MGLHKTKKHLHNWRNGHHIEEAAHKMRENPCQFYNRERINNQNLQETKKS